MSFPHGIPGFPESSNFVLLDHRPDSIFRWLQSIDQGELAFVVIDPLLVNKNYPLDTVKRLLEQLEVCQDDEIIVLSICTVPPAPDQTTVNLLAPIGIGVQSRQGAQVILHDSKYSPQTELSLQDKAA